MVFWEAPLLGTALQGLAITTRTDSMTSGNPIRKAGPRSRHVWAGPIAAADWGPPAPDPEEAPTGCMYDSMTL